MSVFYISHFFPSLYLITMTWSTAIKNKFGWGQPSSVPTKKSSVPWGSNKIIDVMKADNYARVSSRTFSIAFSSAPRSWSVTIPSAYSFLKYTEDRHGYFLNRPDNRSMHNLHWCYPLDCRQLPLHNRYTNGLRIDNNVSAVIYNTTSRSGLRSHV